MYLTCILMYLRCIRDVSEMYPMYPSMYPSKKTYAPDIPKFNQNNRSTHPKHYLIWIMVLSGPRISTLTSSPEEFQRHLITLIPHTISKTVN